MRDAEDRVTLRDSLTPSGGTIPSLFETLTVQMNLTSLLDLPLLALSNGQTRRARIVKAILDKPELLLLDEPLSKYCIFIFETKILIHLRSWS
jgi:energy-coupling factor transporter ATP-binding protein EcfA2